MSLSSTTTSDWNVPLTCHYGPQTGLTNRGSPPSRRPRVRHGRQLLSPVHPRPVCVHLERQEPPGDELLEPLTTNSKDVGCPQVGASVRATRRPQGATPQGSGFEAVKQLGNSRRRFLRLSGRALIRRRWFTSSRRCAATVANACAAAVATSASFIWAADGA